MSPDSTSHYSAGFRFFVFTCRDPGHDFRLPLVDALRQRADAYYIWLRRHPQISGPTEFDPGHGTSIAGLLRFIRGVPRDDRINVYLNSSNTYFPFFSTLLRRLAPPGVWCFDMHDDLRYHNEGLKRWRETAIVSALCRMSDVVVHAAPSLQELFPASRHLGNASHLRLLDLSGASWDDVLVIASFDARFDFDFLSTVARLCPTFRFHLHGWTRSGDTVTTQRITQLTAEHRNVVYHGPYTMETLPDVLRRYRISVAPYRPDTLLTRYIDPLRFYHCLNAGLEVVSTAIPQARSMSAAVHVVEDAATCREALIAIRTGASRKQDAYQPITWEQRADRLIDIVSSLPHTAALRQRQSSLIQRSLP